jgi:hypothetical protein
MFGGGRPLSGKPGSRQVPADLIDDNQSPHSGVNTGMNFYPISEKSVSGTTKSRHHTVNESHYWKNTKKFDVSNFA